MTYLDSTGPFLSLSWSQLQVLPHYSPLINQSVGLEITSTSLLSSENDNENKVDLNLDPQFIV